MGRTELDVRSFIQRAVLHEAAPSWTLGAWERLDPGGRAFVVEHIHAAGVTPQALAAPSHVESVLVELRVAVGVWVARYSEVSPHLLVGVVDRMRERGMLTDAEARRIVEHSTDVARGLTTAGCTSTGIFDLLVSSPLDLRMEPLAHAMRAHADSCFPT